MIPGHGSEKAPMGAPFLCYGVTRDRTSGLRFRQDEFPGAEPFVRVFVGRAGDTFRLDAAVNVFGETSVFDEACALAGIVGHVFPRARALDAATAHFQDQGAIAAVQAW